MQRPSRRPAIPLSRLLGNRDFIIVIECKKDAVFVQPWGSRFLLTAFSQQPDPGHPLYRFVQQIIARRQASVRLGEPPYRPVLRFKIFPDGLRAYYLAYPLLEGLGVSMTRENVN